MELLGALKALFDTVPRALSWLEERRDPVRAQAARVLRAFEAHGIASTQIARLLPPEFPLPMTAFVNAQSLRGHLTPAFLDWVAGLFLLDRTWLDCVPDTAPHSPYPNCFYKQPGELNQWLQERIGDHPQDFALYILKADLGTPSSASSGPFALVLQEYLPGLDEGVITRYQRLSEGAHFEHPPCSIDLLASCAVADALSIRLRGLVVSRKQLQCLEDGTALIPEAMRKPKDIWQPDRLLYAPPTDSRWFQSVRQEASEWLQTAGLVAANSRLNATSAAEQTPRSGLVTEQTVPSKN